MVHPLVTQRVLIGYVYRRPPPMNQFLPLVLISCIELRLTTQPKLVTVKEFQPTLHIVEHSIIDVVQ